MQRDILLQQGAGGRELWGSGLVFKSDFTNEMDIGLENRTGRSQSASCHVAPGSAVHGGTSLVFHHFVSEISDLPPKP